MDEFDFLDDIGEGAYYLDEENRIDNNDEHPTDVLTDELEAILCECEEVYE